MENAIIVGFDSFEKYLTEKVGQDEERLTWVKKVFQKADVDKNGTLSR